MRGVLHAILPAKRPGRVTSKPLAEPFEAIVDDLVAWMFVRARRVVVVKAISVAEIEGKTSGC